MNCEQFRLDDRMERYVRGELGDEERNQFEEHYFACVDCFDALQTVRALHAELSDTESDVAAPADVSNRRWQLPAAAAIAASIVGIAFWWAGAQGLVMTPELLVRLSSFDPPSYSPSVLRQSSDDARLQFQDAMQFYSGGDFAMAGVELRKAADLDPDAANVRFFLGVSLLLTENTNDGIDQLSRTIALGDTPYLEEAYLYRARGHLGRTDVQAARRDLEVLIGLQGSQEAKARELLDALEVG